jgi:hypothetical protein
MSALWQSGKDDGSDQTLLQPSEYNKVVVALEQALSDIVEVVAILEQALSDIAGKAAASHAHAPSEVTGTAVVTADTRLSDARTPTAHGSAQHTGTIGTPTSVGLANVTNDAQLKAADKAAASGVASLDAGSKLVQAHTAEMGGIVHATLSAGATAMALATNSSVKVTPNATATYTTTVPAAGNRRTIIILTSGTSSYTITFGTGFKPTGTLATGTSSAKVFVLHWISDGTNLYEAGRTAAMTA